VEVKRVTDVAVGTKFMENGCQMYQKLPRKGTL
jgi:hypothetical protein